MAICTNSFVINNLEKLSEPLLKTYKGTENQVGTKLEVSRKSVLIIKRSEETCYFGKRSDNRDANRILFSKRRDNEMVAPLPYQTIDCMNLMSHRNARLGHKLFGKRSVEVQLWRLSGLISDSE